MSIYYDSEGNLRITSGPGFKKAWDDAIKAAWDALPQNQVINKPTDMSTPTTFGTALQALKDGKKVMRKGWNGKGMFLYLVPANSYPAVTEVGRQIARDLTPEGQESNGKVPYTAYVAIKTVQGNVSPWQPSNNDMLSEDWVIL